MLTDYHTHTPLCQHAEGTPDLFIEAALKVGLDEYGIADHAPMPDEPFDDWRMFNHQLPDYFRWIERCKTLAPTSLKIRAGLECDWVEGMNDWTAHLNTLYDWDYLIGSVHYIGEKWNFDNPLFADTWGDLDIEEIWTDYWHTFTQMASSGLYDILGHADLIKKFNFYPEGDLTRFYKPAIEAIADSGSALEINTSGWYKNCEEAFPHIDFLKLAAKGHIPLTINSDAHAPHELGRDLMRGRALAKEAGFTHLTLFDKKKKSHTPI